MKAYVITDLLAYMEREYRAQECSDHADALRQAISIIRNAGHDDDDPISEPARGQLFPLMQRANVTLEGLKAHLLVEYGICSTKAIPWGLYDEVCEWLVGQDPERKFVHEPMIRFVEKEPITPKSPQVQPQPTTVPTNQPPHRRKRPRIAPVRRAA